MSFGFRQAVEAALKNTLNYDTASFTVHLIGPQSVYTPDRTTTSLTTALGDEIGVGGYSHKAQSGLTIVKVGDRVDTRMPSSLTWTSLASGITVYAVVLGTASGDIPVWWWDASTPVATTGGDFTVNWGNADANFKSV